MATPILAAAPINQPAIISTQPLHELLVTYQLDAPATVISLNRSVIASQLSGQLKTLPVRVGDALEKGDIIATIDCRDYQHSAAVEAAQLQALRSQYTLASQQLKRARKLGKQRNASRELIDQRNSNKLNLAAQINAQTQRLQQAKIQQQRCVITAPFKGMITRRLASEGQIVNPSTAIVELLDLQRLELKADIPLSYSQTLAQQKTFSFRFQDQQHDVTLRRLLPLSQRQARTREARFDFSKATDLPIPGGAGRLQWQPPGHYLSANQMLRRNGKLGVFLYQQGRNQQGWAKFHPIPKAEEGRPALTTLAEDTAIITQGQHGLEDGALVRLHTRSAEE